MAIVLDTSVLIDHKRAPKNQKANTLLYRLSGHHELNITVVSVFELLRGDNKGEDKFWVNFFSKVKVLPFDYESSMLAGRIDKELIKKGNKIQVTDLFIGAIAITHNLPVATKDKKAFSRIEHLTVISS